MKMRNILMIAIILASFSSYSQIEFENGYIINNNSEKINCLIKNNDWKYNPSEILYKLDENSDIKRGTIEDIQEFGITSKIKFKRFLVDIDMSREDTNKLTQEKNPLFKEETLFLKQLIEGKANIFIYKSPSMTRFFYSLDNSDIEQLIYKKYKTSEGKISTNNKFRQQLWNALICDEISIQEVEGLNYSIKDLQNYFIKYNTCTSSDYIRYKKERKGKSFFIKLKPGVNYGSMKIKKGLNAGGVKMDNNLSFKVGVENEFILPFNNDKWSIFIEPSYTSYKGETYYGPSNKIKLNVNFNYIELGLGLRHYLFLNPNSKLNFNVGLIHDLPVNSEIIYYMNNPLDPTLNDFQVTPSINFGVGYNYNKFSFEVNLGLGREIKGSKIVPNNYDLQWKSMYQNVSFVFGYNIF